MNRPAPHELWQQADGDRERYRQLMIEHGHLIPLKCRGRRTRAIGSRAGGANRCSVRDVAHRKPLRRKGFSACVCRCRLTNRNNGTAHPAQRRCRPPGSRCAHAHPDWFGTHEGTMPRPTSQAKVFMLELANDDPEVSG